MYVPSSRPRGANALRIPPDFYDLFKPKRSFQDEVIRGYFYIITPTQMDDPYLGVVNSVLGYYPPARACSVVR